MKNLEKLEEELDKKLNELIDYVSVKGNNYLSEEADRMRQDISILKNKIEYLKSTERELQLKEAIEILQYLMQTNLNKIYKGAINRVLQEVEKRL